ncbi:FAD-binding oxidoreductase [Clostridium sediminicola]|uniref:FAD-binding oxidoreductase n=1 Tax=Clostridium sediminicola TaxID=3114879 RepID=UPI0031F22505
MVNNLIKPVNKEFAEYLRDESRVSGKADSISFPREEKDVIKLMKRLYSKGSPITFQGARTGLAAGAVPHSGHIMNLSRMDKVTSMRRDECGTFYVTVEPGVILSNLREQIKGKKFKTNKWDSTSKNAFIEFCETEEQFFSPDPTEASATIGGMVACNASGARSYLYGSTRNHVNALRIVLFNGDTLWIKRGENFADGRVLRLNTEQNNSLIINLPSYEMPKTKSASGYYVENNMDAIDLFIGSDGTLGGITEIELRLLPLPQYNWGVNCFFERIEDSVDFVVKIREQLEHIAVIEFFDGEALSILRKQKIENPGFSHLPDTDESMNAAIYVEIHCKEEQEALNELKAVGLAMNASGGNNKDTWVARTDSDIDRLIFFRHAVPESVNMLIDKRKKKNPIITKLGTDMSVPDKYLKEVMKLYRDSLEEYKLQSAMWGHIGDNHLHVNLLPNSEEEYLKGKELYEKWAVEVTKMGGAVSAEHGVGKLKSEFLTVMYGEEFINEMAEMKLEFDPRALIGTGNMFIPLKRGDLK